MSTVEIPSKSESDEFAKAKENIMPKAKPQQIDKFREAARELETDDDEARFDAKLRRIVKTTPPKDESKKESSGG